MANTKATNVNYCTTKRLVRYSITLAILLITSGNLFCFEYGDNQPFELKVIKNGILLHTFVLKNEAEIEHAHVSCYYTNPIIYLFLVPGCVIFLAFFIKRKSIIHSLIVFSLVLLAGTGLDFPRETLAAGIQDFKAGNYKSALNAFNLALVKEKQNPAILYNRALCHYMLNQKGLALHSLRQSLKRNPQDTEAQKALTDIEFELGLKFQVAPVKIIHPNITFIGLILLFNFVLIALGLVFRYHKGTLFIIFVFFTFAFFSVFVIFIDSLVKINEQTGVVIAKEGILKKIPLDKAQCWLHLKEGTSVNIAGFAEDYALVKTGLRFEGWIKKAQLVTD